VPTACSGRDPQGTPLRRAGGAAAGPDPNKIPVETVWLVFPVAILWR
jgi:hypothetical protein